jgi:hypothetical protein
MSAKDRFAGLISDAPCNYPQAALDASGCALIDTIACMFAGCTQAVTSNALAAVQAWGAGNSPAHAELWKRLCAIEASDDIGRDLEL